MTNIFDNASSVIHDNKRVVSIVTGDGGVIYEASCVEFTFTGTTLTQYSSGSFKGIDMTIDYGDGTIETTTGKFGHTYSQNGTYTVKIYGVTSLENYCFRDCTGLTSINIPNTVTSIGSVCFYGCTGLTSINIPSSVTSIGNNCFGNCTGLTSITLSNSITSIGSNCFYGCTGLTSINIPSSVTSIGNICFGNCTGLTSITIPNTVISIGNDCFRSCSGLTSIILNWTTSDQIITYNSSWIRHANNNVKYKIPTGTKSLYIAKGYPSDRLDDGTIISSVNLSATKTTLSKSHNDTTTLTATVIDSNNQSVNGETVQLYNGNTLIGTMTESNGTYSYTYTSQGSGDLSLSAKCENISSNSINIEDCFYYKSEESTTVPIQCSCTPNCIAQYEIYPVNVWNWHYINVSDGTNSQSVATLSTSYHNNSSASIKTTYFPPQNKWTPMEFKIQNNVATITSNGTNKGSTNITVSNINTLIISNSYTNTILRNVKIKPL